jgi:hypothetical protein
LVGASANTVGVIFTATGTTTGDGTVSGQQGVEKGEQWLDTTGGAYDLKIYDGTSWRSQAGEFVNVTGDTMTGALNISTADNLALHLTRTGATGGTKLRLENADDNSFDIEFDQNEALSLNSELVIDSSGRVLIGPLTSYAVAPCDDLQVGSNTSADNAGITIGSTTQCQIAFADSADTRAGLLHYQHSDDSMRFYTAGAANERMRIDSSGNIGIGTTSPSLKLSVDGDIGLYSGNTEYGKLFNDAGVLHLRGAANMELALGTEAQERLRIDSSGNVGIGTTSPADVLHIKHSSASCTNRIESATSYAELYLVGASAVNYISSDNPVAFYVGASEWMRIDSAGNVGIGTNQPSKLFEIQGVSSGTAAQAVIRLRDQYSGGWTQNTDNGSIEFYSADSNGPGAGVRSKIANTVEDTSGAAQALTFWTTTNTSGQTLTERMRIDSSGNVLLGKSSQDLATAGFQHRGDAIGLVQITRDSGEPLQLNRLTNDGKLIEFRKDTASVVGAISIQGSDLGIEVNGSERVRIDSSGRLLVGTSSSSTADSLVLNGNSSGSANPSILRMRRTGAIAAHTEISQIEFASTATRIGADIKCQAEDTWATGDTPGRLVFSTTADGASSPTERMRIDSSGRLLVGTSSVTGISSQLTVVGGNIATFHNTTNDQYSPAVYLSKARGTGSQIVSNGDGVGYLAFVGYDGTQPLRAAGIEAFVDGTPGTNDMPGRLVFSTTADGASSPTERMRITNSGVVYIGATGQSGGGAPIPNDSGVSIDQDGTIRTRINSNGNYQYEFANASASVVGYIQVNSGSVTYSTTSDYRLKENLQPLAGATERIKQLSVYRFNFISDPDTQVDGFVAHEVQSVVPEAISGTKDAVHEDGSINPQGIDQSKLVPLLTAALQEALQKIETLEQRLNDAGIA